MKSEESCIFTMALDSASDRGSCKAFASFWPAFLTFGGGVSWSILFKPSIKLEAKADLESTNSKNNGWASWLRIRIRQLGQFGHADPWKMEFLQSIQKPCPVMIIYQWMMDERSNISLFFSWVLSNIIRIPWPTAWENHNLVDGEMRKADWTMSNRHLGRKEEYQGVVLEEEAFIKGKAPLVL